MLLSFGYAHRLLSSSFLGLPCRILNMNHKKELLRGLWVGLGVLGVGSGDDLHARNLHVRQLRVPHVHFTAAKKHPKPQTLNPKP